MFKLIRRVRDKFRRKPPTPAPTVISSATIYGYQPVTEDVFLFGADDLPAAPPATDGIRAARAFGCIYGTKEQHDMAVRFFHRAKHTIKYNPGRFE